MAIAEDHEFVAGKWVDFGIALKTPRDPYKPNDVPARVLAGELNRRGISLGSGKLIPYNVLRNVKNPGSDYGMVLNLSDQFENSSVRDLDEFRWNYTIDEGMSRAYLGGCRSWDYDYRNLVDSDGIARVVVV